MSTKDLLFTATREPSYVRNLLVRRALAGLGRLTEATSALPSYPLRLTAVSARLILRRPKADLIWVGFFGQPLVPLVKRLYPGRPVILDAFVSAFDTLCLDRQTLGKNSPGGVLARLLDHAAFRQADVVVVDTLAQRRFLTEEFPIGPDKVVVHRLGYDEKVFRPLPPAPSSGICVFFYGSFLPLHGVETILAAAKLLTADPRVHFLIGGGPAGRHHLRALGKLPNVRFVGYIPYGRLPDFISKAHICLAGPFGTTLKAGRVITGKTYQFLACRRATVVGDNEANRELFTPGQDVWFVPRGDPEALAEAIGFLADHRSLRDDLAEAGWRRVRGFDTAGQVRQLSWIQNLLG